MAGWLYLSLGAGALALLVALGKAIWVSRQDPGNERLREIGSAIRSGAMAFLAREYKILLLIVVAVVILLVLGERGYNRFVAVSFLTGAVFSIATLLNVPFLLPRTRSVTYVFRPTHQETCQELLKKRIWRDFK